MRSEKIEEREEATQKLRMLERAAEGELSKAARVADPEVAGRARVLLRRLEIQTKFSFTFRKTFPGVGDRLASGNPRVRSTPSGRGPSASPVTGVPVLPAPELRENPAVGPSGTSPIASPSKRRPLLVVSDWIRKHDRIGAVAALEAILKELRKGK